MYLKTRGLVLRETEYGEADKLLTVLTPEHGKMTLRARGVRRRSSPLKSSCQLLAYGEFTLFEYKNRATINEAEALELFPELRNDLELLSLASYFAQVAEDVSQEDSPNPEILSLVLNSLYALGKLAKPQALVKAAFELRIACLAGYTPDLTGCVQCGREEAERFDLSAGCLECADHRSPESGGLRIPVKPGVLAAMRYIVYCEPKRLFSFALPEKALESLGGLTEGFLMTQLERSFYTLDFYKSLTLTAPGLPELGAGTGTYNGESKHV